MGGPLLLALLLIAGAGPALADSLPGARPIPAALAARLEHVRAEVASPRTRHLDAAGRPLFVNRLALEASPYLLQHAHNPVNWFPWGDEAFAEARRLDRPVLISIGYSTCHWCHVMEEQSFEDLEIAEALNANYVAIKVDREERPDVDSVYMSAVRALTGSGGWPMTIWATADGVPFFAGTYFPPRGGKRRPGFLPTLGRIAGLWERQRGQVGLAAARLQERVRASLSPQPAVGVPGTAEIRRALDAYRQGFDAQNGGLRGRRKFPATLPIPLLLRAHRRTGDDAWLAMARRTLDAMRRGGLYDHVGGGFHRYTTDSTWTVPHFEKMLYDNALLTQTYVVAWQHTGDPAYQAVVRDVLAYVAREMTASEGSFYSATDADSEGEEGLYFIWDHESLRAAVGEAHYELAAAAYGLDGPPNFEKTHWVLRADRDPGDLATTLGRPLAKVEAELAEIRARMRAAREQRVAPLLDDKQIVAWNGLMISAFARAGLALREPGYVESASAAAGALLALGRPDGKLARYLKQGKPHGVGLLDDHAFLVSGLLDLYEADGQARWLDAALALQREQDERFFDERNGGYWISPHEAVALLGREKPIEDGARPSGNSVAALNLLRLYHLTGDAVWFERAEMTMRAFSDRLRLLPSAYGRMLEAVDFLTDTPKEILIVTPGANGGAEPFLAALGSLHLPNRVLVVASEPQLAALEQRVPLLADKRALGGRATAYVCENRTCELPARDPATFARQLAKPARPYPAP